jgi:hypothetical protein
LAYRSIKEVLWAKNSRARRSDGANGSCTTRLESIGAEYVISPQTAAPALRKWYNTQEGAAVRRQRSLNLLGFCPQFLASLDDQVPKKAMRFVGICLDKFLCLGLHFPAMAAETVTIISCGTCTNSTGIHDSPPSSRANS